MKKLRSILASVLAVTMVLTTAVPTVVFAADDTIFSKIEKDTEKNDDNNKTDEAKAEVKKDSKSEDIEIIEEFSYVDDYSSKHLIAFVNNTDETVDVYSAVPGKNEDGKDVEAPYDNVCYGVAPGDVGFIMDTYYGEKMKSYDVKVGENFGIKNSGSKAGKAITEGLDFEFYVEDEDTLIVGVINDSKDTFEDISLGIIAYDEDDNVVELTEYYVGNISYELLPDECIVEYVYMMNEFDHAEAYIHGTVAKKPRSMNGEDAKLEIVDEYLSETYGTLYRALVVENKSDKYLNVQSNTIMLDDEDIIVDIDGGYATIPANGVGVVYESFYNETDGDLYTSFSATEEKYYDECSADIKCTAKVDGDYLVIDAENTSKDDIDNVTAKILMFDKDDEFIGYETIYLNTELTPENYEEWTEDDWDDYYDELFDNDDPDMKAGQKKSNCTRLYGKKKPVSFEIYIEAYNYDY